MKVLSLFVLHMEQSMLFESAAFYLLGHLQRSLRAKTIWFH